MRAESVYIQYDGAVTKRYYTILCESRGVAVVLAMKTFRAQKCSARAKVYTKRSYTLNAYSRKEYSMGELCKVLDVYSTNLMIRYGWKEDPTVRFATEASFVLYVELPTGQISFHNPRRGNGPDYPGEWDHARSSQERILKFCDMVFDREWPTHAEAFQQPLLKENSGT